MPWRTAWAWPRGPSCWGTRAPTWSCGTTSTCERSGSTCGRLPSGRRRGRSLDVLEASGVHRGLHHRAVLDERRQVLLADADRAPAHAQAEVAEFALVA